MIFFKKQFYLAVFEVSNNFILVLRKKYLHIKKLTDDEDSKDQMDSLISSLKACNPNCTESFPF